MRFMVLDYIFPPLAAVFTALLWAWLLHLIRRQWVHRARDKKLVLFPFIAALLDWAENVGFLGTVLLYPTRMDWLTSSAVFFRQLKLAAMGVSGVITVALICLAVIAIIKRMMQPEEKKYKWRRAGQ